MIKDWAIKGMKAEVERLGFSDMEIVRAKVCKDKEDERLFDSIYKREKGKSIVSDFRREFGDFYFGQKREDFYFDPKEVRALKEIVKKVVFTLGEPADRQYIVDFFVALLQSITDKWILDRLSPTIINSKYNEIVAKARASYAPAKNIGELFSGASHK